MSGILIEDYVEEEEVKTDEPVLEQSVPVVTSTVTSATSGSPEPAAEREVSIYSVPRKRKLEVEDENVIKNEKIDDSDDDRTRLKKMMKYCSSCGSPKTTTSTFLCSSCITDFTDFTVEIVIKHKKKLSSPLNLKLNVALLAGLTETHKELAGEHSSAHQKFKATTCEIISDLIYHKEMRT